MMNEADTREKLVIPKLKEAGWDIDTQIIREFPIRSKRYYVNGEDYEEVEPKDRFADIILKVNNVIVGVVEVKKEEKSAEDGLAQAKDYSQRLDVPIAYSTNGHSIIVYDRRTMETKDVECFLSPSELYGIYLQFKGLQKENNSPLEHPEYLFPGKRMRAYQDTAVRRVIEAILKGRKKVLLTMATGTGKTFVSFQVVWKLVRSNYFSRVLFLTDRIFLRDQAYDFYEPFGNARSKIKGSDYEKNRKIYFSTYQTLYKGGLYKKIPEDFFDLIIVDECHRSRYGDWGIILDHFKTAHHLGMTATPKRMDNIDVYDYFGEPVFEYSMARAIEDGYLVPYKIYKIATNIDKEGLTVSPGVEIIYDDEVSVSKIKPYYSPSEFERKIKLPDRTELMCKKILEIMNTTEPNAKTIIYCVDMEHAQDVTNTLNRLTGRENFSTRIVSEEKDDLTTFRDAERVYPVVATTVDLLSTGIDIPHLKNIVFMKPVASVVLFKQIIGRGSRLSANKGFFRIIDFTNATRLLDEWDIPHPVELKSEPERPIEPFDKRLKGFVVDKTTNERIEGVRVKAKIGRFQKDTFTDKDGFFELEDLPSNKTIKVVITMKGYITATRRVETNGEPIIFELKPQVIKPRKIKVEGIPVNIAEEVTIEINGNTTKAQYREYVKNNVLKRVHNLNELKELWLDYQKRTSLLEELKKKGVSVELIRRLEELDDVDGFDILAHIVFNAPLITTGERVKRFVNLYNEVLSKYCESVREIVFNVLEKYERGGIDNLEIDVLDTPDLRKKNAFNILKENIGLNKIPLLFDQLKKNIYF